MTEQSPAEAIFFAALEKATPEEREAFVESACGDDANLRQRVERLLAAHPHAKNFLEPPASPNNGVVDAATLPPRENDSAEPNGTDAFPHRAPSEGVGSVIAGRYKLIESLGQGGMGAVYMAQQTEPVKRLVALKLIKRGMDSRQILTRFEAERQALALMDHPNIAKVLDAGATESGRPFFVMELVKGVPITRFCDERQLSTRERLELFIPVCQAIQHAHQKGVIHRDIKPTNVLVALYDDRPVPKVIDFGVAKAAGSQLTDASLVTGFGAIVGTPEYMSPEQAQLNQLDVDTRSDVYALGVLLYELLTGTTPIDRKRLGQDALFEVLRVIREEEPPRPSARLSTSNTLASIAATRKTEPAKLTRLMRGELDWIVMKCLEKERSRRYETANGLARDLQRYLADEQVEACPPSVVYRLKKFARNHRTALTTAALLAALLLIGAAVSGWQAFLARQAEKSALADRDAKEKALHVATESEKKANDAAVAEIEERKLAEKERDAKRIALNDAEGLRMTAQSSVALPSNPGLALLLAVEAARHGSRRAPHNNAMLAALNASRELRTLQIPDVAFANARFSRDGRFLLTITGPRESRRLNAYATMAAQVWEAATGRMLLSVHVPGLFFSDVDLSPDGRRLITSFMGAAIARYTDDRQFIFTDHSARIWNVTTGEELTLLKGHTDRIVSARFSPDGNQVLTSSWDGSARLWDAATGKELRKLAADKYSLVSASFSADGRRVLTFCDLSSNKSSADVSDFHQRGGWDKDAVRDAPLPTKATVTKIQSLFNSGSGGSNWSGNEDTRRRARLWDSATGQQIAVLMREEDRKSSVNETTCAAFSPDGRFALTGDIDGTSIIWDTITGKLSKRWDRTTTTPNNPDGSERFYTLTSVGLSADGRQLIRVHADNSVSILDVEKGREITHLTGFSSGIRSAEVSVDGRSVLVLPGDEARMSRAQWYPGSDGQLVVNVSDDRTVYLRDVGTGKEIAAFRGHEDDVASAAFRPDGRQIVTASRDGTVRIWNAENIDSYATVLRGHRSALAEAAFSADGRYMLTAFGMKSEVTGSVGGDREVRVWDASGQPVSVLKGLAALGNSPVRERLLGAVRCAQFSPDGQRVLVASVDYAARMEPPDAKPDPKWTYTPARIMETNTGNELVALRGLTCGLRYGSFSPDGRLILTVSDRTENKRILTAKGEERGNSSGSGTPDYSVRIWDAMTGAVVRTLIDKNEMCDCAAWSPDGRRVITAGWRNAPLNRYAVQIWDVALGKVTLDLDEKAGPIEEVVFSHDGKRVAGFRRNYTTDRELVPLWDTETGKAVAVLKGHTSDVTAVAFSPDGHWLATSSQDRTTRIWDAASGKPRIALTGHERAINSVSYSKDGSRLVTGSDDGTARIWDLATGNEFITLSGHEGPVYAAVFSPDGREVLTASGDGTARIWPVDPLPIAETRKPRNFTADERRRFMISDEK